MGNIVELRKLVKDVLNSKCSDPYDNNSTRIGKHFFDEAEGLNLTRANTFPKGFLKGYTSAAPEKDNIGRTGHVRKSAMVAVFYYSKEKLKYTVNGVTYSDQDLVSYMLNEIQTVLLNNKFINYHLSPSSFSGDPEIIIDKGYNNQFKLYRGLITITYYWYETYGN